MPRNANWRTVVVLTLTLICGGCAENREPTAADGGDSGSGVDPEAWPNAASPVVDDPAIDARIDDLLAAMTVEQKVGQTIQADIGSVTPDDVREYRLGSILNGGSSGPYGDDRAPVGDWLKLADEFWQASVDPDGVSVTIPIMWGIDAVHGHSNVVGATIFPHNIGLGAARDAELIEAIGAATAMEIRVTGLDWTFAPTLAVARDDRWGRTYESYSEDPDIVAAYAGAMVRGLQGNPGTDEFLGDERVIATAKHFVGDGGTRDGRDQGDTQVSEAELREIHAAGYYTAIDAGVQSVMASFSSWNGAKMHGHRGLLTDVLIGRLGFDGFVVGDWNGHGKIDGCSNEDCPAALNAGVDMYMAPDSWRGLYASTLEAVRSGEIPMVRLDEAVRRILRVKLRAGLFAAGRPSSRPLAGRLDIIGSVEHRALARDAVRQSLVLLKNDGNVLPLESGKDILVVGHAADDMSRQAGGWTISWQGLDTTHADFPDGQTILEGIRDTAQGGNVRFSPDGKYDERPDVAIVVFGELPYAEFKGDLTDVEFRPEDDSYLDAARALRADGVPVVTVFLSGRPLWVNRELNASDAFVAAWLPGTEGGGIADVLFERAVDGNDYDFSGRLSFSWPRTGDQVGVNRGDDDYEPLFPYGFGLSRSTTQQLGTLDETPAGGTDRAAPQIFAAGKTIAPWSLRAESEAISLAHFDRFAQEDALSIKWAGPAPISFEGAAADLRHLAQPDAGFVLTLRVDDAPDGPVTVAAAREGMRLTAVDIGPQLRGAIPGEWTEVTVPLRCIATGLPDWATITSPVIIEPGSAMTIGLSEIRIDGLPEAAQVCPN